MPPRRRVDPNEMRAAVAAVAPWLADPWAEDAAQRPSRAETASAVKLSLRTLEAVAPGRTVEVRVPPFAAVQCVAGPEHTRGTPPNVIETDARTWLLLATGRLDFPAAVESGLVSASGSRADLTPWLPLVRVEG